jgi:hypothetical protein
MPDHAAALGAFTAVVKFALFIELGKVPRPVAIMSDQTQEDVPVLNPTMATRAAIPGSTLSVHQTAGCMARHKHAYGRSRWECAAHFVWDTLTHLSSIITFLRWLLSPLLGGMPNPIVSAVNTSTPPGFCAAPPDGSWCAVCVVNKNSGPAASIRFRDRCAKVSLHWVDHSVDLSITKTNTIEVAALVGDRIVGAASNDGTLLLCCGSSGRVSLFSVGNQGDCIAVDVPAGPWNCDVGGCAILSTRSKSVLRNFLFVCDASGRFFVGSTFEQEGHADEKPSCMAWRWLTCKTRSKLSIVHFLSQVNDVSFVIGGLGHMNLCGALELYDLAVDESGDLTSRSSSCHVEVVRRHSSLKNALPFSMCVSASAGRRGILAVFNDGSVVMLSSSSLRSVDKIWSPDVFRTDAGSALVAENTPFAAWMQRVVRVGWWSENAIVVIRRNGCCSIHSTISDNCAMKLLGPLEMSSNLAVSSELEVVQFLEGMPSATCFSHSSLKGSVWSVSAPTPTSTDLQLVHLRASDTASVFSSLIKRSCDFATLSSDVLAKPFSGAREFYLKFHNSCIPKLSLDTLLVAEFVSSKESLEQRILLLHQMSSALVVERAVRLLVCSLSELIFHLETTILHIDVVRVDDEVHSELINTLLWARIFSVSNRDGLDFKEFLNQSFVPVWGHLKVLDEATFPRSYREYICKRIVRDEVADVALALMMCDAPLFFDKYKLVDDIVFHFWNYCAPSYEEICCHMSVFEDTSTLRNLLPSVDGRPLRIYEQRHVCEQSDHSSSKDATRYSAIGFLDEDVVTSWYRKRIALIELQTGNVCNVRDLLDVAVSQCNLIELASELDDACDFYGFVYMTPICNIPCDDASMESFKLYSPPQRLWRLLSTFPLEDVPSAIVGVGRELVDRHNMQYASFLDCVRRWAFDRGTATDLHSPRRSATTLTGTVEYYKYDFLFAAIALETLNDASIDVLSWDEHGEAIVDLVFSVCMRCSSDHTELDAVSRLLNLYSNISGFASTESRNAALAKLAEIDVIRSAADVFRVRGIDPIQSNGEVWYFNTLIAKRGDFATFEFICSKIVDQAVCSDDIEISDPEFLQRDLTALARFNFGSDVADEEIGPLLLRALLQLRQWVKAEEYSKSLVFCRNKEVIFRSFQSCVTNAILCFENPAMSLTDCVHDAEICLQIAKNLIASPTLDSCSDDESRKFTEFNEIVHKQETLHRIAILIEDCGLENVQLPQISLAYFGDARQRRDIVAAIISEAPAIAPSQVMQLIEWFNLKDNKKDAVDVLSNATVQAFDAGRIMDAFELAKELCIFGQGESLPWAMLCKLARQAQSHVSDVQQNIVSTAVLHAPASDILDERNDRHWHINLPIEGETMYGVGVDVVMRLLCEDFSSCSNDKQWIRIKCIIVDSVCGVDPSLFKIVSQCLLDLCRHKCVLVNPKILDRSLEFVRDIEIVMHSAHSFGDLEILRKLCGGDDDVVAGMVDDIISQDELISCTLLKSILNVIECPEIARTRSESFILNVYKLGLSPFVMQNAVRCLSQFLPPWSWRHTLAEVTLRDHASVSATKGMLRCIVFAHAMSEVDSVVIGDIDYSLPHHSDESFDDRVQVLAAVGGANALNAAKHMQVLLEFGVDLSLSEIMSVCWQADHQLSLHKAVDIVHMVIGPHVEEGHVYNCVKMLLHVLELLGLVCIAHLIFHLFFQLTFTHSATILRCSSALTVAGYRFSMHSRSSLLRCRVSHRRSRRQCSEAFALLSKSGQLWS